MGGQGLEEIPQRSGRVSGGGEGWGRSRHPPRLPDSAIVCGGFLGLQEAGGITPNKGEEAA